MIDPIETYFKDISKEPNCSLCDKKSVIKKLEEDGFVEYCREHAITKGILPNIFLNR